MKKLFCFLLCIFFEDISAQCAMCKAVVQSGGEGLATSINNGIVYLMLFPYLLIGILGYFLYKKRCKS